MKSALTALQDFSESSGEDSSASSDDDSAPGLDESIITPGDIRVNPEKPLQSQNSISYDFWYLQTSDGQIIGPHPQSHVSSWYKNGDLDPSVLLSPAMRIHGTNQWVTDPLTLQFQAIDVYRMYMGNADDENKTSKTDDQVRAEPFAFFSRVCIIVGGRLCGWPYLLHALLH